jgi:hypothetical protein
MRGGKLGTYPLPKKKIKIKMGKKETYQIIIMRSEVFSINTNNLNWLKCKSVCKFSSTVKAIA